MAVLTLLSLAGWSKSQMGNITFGLPLPTDYAVRQGDLISLPLDEYVNIKGALFSTPGQNAVITHKMALAKEFTFTDGRVDGCDHSISYNGFFLMVCKDQNLVKIKIDDITREVLSTEVFVLKKDAQADISDQACYDIIISANWAYVACRFKFKDPTFNQIQVYTVNVDTMTLGELYAVTNNGKVKGSFRMSMANFGVNFARKMILFYDGGVPTTTAGSVFFVSAFIKEGNPSSLEAGKEYNLAGILQTPTLDGNVRHIAQYSSGTVFVVTGLAGAAPQSLHFSTLKFESDGSLTQDVFGFLTWRPGNIKDFVGAQFGVTSLLSGQVLTLKMADRANFFALNVTMNITTNKFVMSQPSINLLDCAEVDNLNSFVGKITVLTPLQFEDTLSNRVLIEYRSKEPDFKIRAFVLYITKAKYGCSKNQIPGTVQAVQLVNRDWLYTFNSGKLFHYKLFHSTRLDIDTKTLTPGKKDYVVTAELSGRYNPATSSLKFEVFDDAKGQNEITLHTKTVTTYKDTVMRLPFGRDNFIGNNPTFTTTPSSPQVRIRHALKADFPLAITMPAGYQITRTFAVDKDTFLTVMRAKGQAEIYNIAHGVWNPVNNTIALTHSENRVLGNGQYIFQAFKLTSTYYCLLLKQTFENQIKLSVSCHEDKVNGTVVLPWKIITTIYDVSEVEVLETKDRVDLLIIGNSNQEKTTNTILLHYWIGLVANSVNTATSVSTVSHVDNKVKGYAVQSLMLDYLADDEGTNHLTLKLIKEGSPPILAKYIMKFEANLPILTFAHLVNTEISDFLHCVNGQEIIFFNPRAREIYSMRWEARTGVPLYNKFYYPTTEIGIQYIYQFVCIPQKELFQVLAVAADGKRYVVTYRGGQSRVLGKRVHSMVEVDKETNFIEVSLGEEEVVTSPNLPGLSTLKRSLLVTYSDGPFFEIDNRGATANLEVTIKQDTGSKQKDDKVLLELITPVLSAAVTTKLRFDLKQGDIDLEKHLDIKGPVMDIAMTGQTEGLKLTQRVTQNKGFMSTEAAPPNKIYVESDYMATLTIGSNIKLFGDPDLSNLGVANPILIDSIVGNFQDVGIIIYNNGYDALVVSKEFKNFEYCYSIHQLYTVNDSGRKLYRKHSYYDLYRTKNDYSDLQVVSHRLNGNVVIGLKSKKELTASYVKLVSFIKQPDGTFVYGSKANCYRQGKRIGTYGLVSDGQSRVFVITYSPNSLGILAATWNGMNLEAILYEVPNNFIISATDSRKLFISYVRCWSDSNTSTKFECFFNSEGFTDYSFDFEINDNQMEGTLFKSITRKHTFQMPPQFETVSIDRTKELYGFHLKKIQINNLSKRVLQETRKLDKFSDCDNIIAVYKPSVNEHIYTAITCSAWNNYPQMDFAMEYLLGDFIFFTKVPPQAPKNGAERLLQGDNDKVTSNIVRPLKLEVTSTSVDPEKVLFTFIGLNGQGDAGNRALKLSELKTEAKQDTPSSGSAWTWIIIILVILVVVGAAVGGFWLYKNRSAHQATGDSYNPIVKEDKNQDMDDSRL